MSAAELSALRDEVKSYVEGADERSLRLIKKAITVIQQESDSEQEVDWDDLPQELRLSIDQAIKQADEGGGTPHDEVVAKYYGQWFKK